jgi:hypothetical protein
VHRTKLASITLALLLASLVLVACGGSSGSSTTTTSRRPAVAPSPSAHPQSDAAGATGRSSAHRKPSASSAKRPAFGLLLSYAACMRANGVKPPPGKRTDNLAEIGGAVYGAAVKKCARLFDQSKRAVPAR